MVVLHFAIHQKPKKLDIQIDILSREDATKPEKEAATAIQDFFMESLRWILEEEGLKVKIKKVETIRERE